MASRNQKHPEHVLTAKSYVLVPEAKSVSLSGSKREARWPTILKYSGHPDGVALAYREGQVSKRHLTMLENRGMLRFDTSPISLSDEKGERQGAVAQETQGRDVSPEGAPQEIQTESHESRYPEGAETYRRHRHLERDGTLPMLAKQKRFEETGVLKCEVCGRLQQRLWCTRGRLH